MILANNITHLINGKNFEVPRDWEGLEIVSNFINKEDPNNVNITDLTFVLEANKFLQERIMSGMNGGVGVFESEPYSILIGDQLNPAFKFDGYLDFTDSLTVLGGESLTCSLKKKKSVDWLSSKADGFSFAYLFHETNKLSKSDFVKVPYVINYIPDNVQMMMLSLSLYVMTKELIENVEKVAEAVADVIDAGTPIIGAGVGLGAVVVTAWDIGNFILVAMKVVGRIAYTIAIVIAIKELMNDLVKQLLPKKRYHLGMTYRRMFEVCCSHLDLKFESTIEHLDLVYIPEKDKKGGEEGETGFPLADRGMGTFGDLIRTCKTMFNAEYTIKDDVFVFERKDKLKKKSSYKIPKTLLNQEKQSDVFKLNTSDMVSNYIISFGYDMQDQNTLDNQDGMVYQVITEPIKTVNKDLVTIKNIAEVNINGTLGKCKKSLTGVEKVLKSVGSFVDKLTGIFGGGTRFGSKVEKRKGSLLLSSDFLTIPKIVSMKGGKISTNQIKDISAEILWKYYHYINSFAELKGKHNQWFIRENHKVPMTLEDFVLILENQSGITEDGENFEIDTMSYFPYSRYAVLSYRINKLYTENLKLSYVK